jgi:hypothetical protein
MFQRSHQQLLPDYPNAAVNCRWLVALHQELFHNYFLNNRDAAKVSPELMPQSGRDSVSSRCKYEHSIFFLRAALAMDVWSLADHIRG